MKITLTRDYRVLLKAGSVVDVDANTAAALKGLCVAADYVPKKQAQKTRQVKKEK